MKKSIYTEKNSEYFFNNPSWHVEDSPWKASQIRKILDRNQLKIGTIAEVGCGAGEILNQLHMFMSKDIRFFGYDISIDAINLAKTRQKDRLNFQCEDLLSSNVYFDLLLMIDVFEHVEDYLGFLKMSKMKSCYTIFHIPLDISVVSLLKKSLIASRKSVGHLHHFVKETALATVIDSGYEIIDFFYTAGALDLPQKFPSNIAYIPRKIMYGINKDMAARILGGFSLLVLAKN